MQVYGLIGCPLSHSFSKTFFSKKFADENIDASYLNFEIPDLSYVAGILEEYPTLKGFNVTIPYKEKIISLLHQVDNDAAEVGAVNVVKIVRSDLSADLVLKGYNTDVIGFGDSLRNAIKGQLHKHALILGTGGASKAVAHVLKKMQIDYQFVSRVKTSENLCYTDLDRSVMESHTLIVNTTPLGTFPKVDTMPDIPYRFLTPSHLLYDLVYNPAQTKFLSLGKKRDAQIKNGLEMLQLQALAAWDIWNNRDSENVDIDE